MKQKCTNRNQKKKLAENAKDMDIIINNFANVVV